MLAHLLRASSPLNMRNSLYVGRVFMPFAAVALRRSEQLANIARLCNKSVTFGNAAHRQGPEPWS